MYRCVRASIFVCLCVCVCVCVFIHQCNANDFVCFIGQIHRLYILVIQSVFIKHLLYLVINWLMKIQHEKVKEPVYLGLSNFLHSFVIYYL